VADQALGVAAGDSDVRQHPVIQAAQLMEVPLNTPPARNLSCETSKYIPKPGRQT